MRQVLYFCIIVIVAAFMYGCSSSGPEISYVNISDAAPVTGQRILLQANSVVDYYPIRYVWTASGGELEEDGRYWAYWIAPETPDNYTVTCTVIDDNDDQETAFFNIDVGQREKEALVDQGALCLAKYRNDKISGVWASTNNDIWYFSSSGESNIGWGDEFTAIAIQGYSSYYYYTYHTIWGAKGNEIYYYRASDDTGTMTCGGCETINTMEVDGSTLWVGANNGLYKCSTATYTCDPTDITEQVYDLYAGEDLTLAATSTGVYSLDTDGTWNEPEAPYTEITYAITVDKDSNIWSVIDDGGSNKVAENGEALLNQPPDGDVITSLDIDLLGRIWCGKYYWDGTGWNVHPEFADDVIKESMVSPEGLVYLRSTSGVLFCW